MSTGEMSLCLRALWFFSEALNSVPSMHGRQLTTACNSSSGGSTGLFWPPWAPASPQTHKHMQTDTVPPSLTSPCLKNKSLLKKEKKIAKVVNDF